MHDTPSSLLVESGQHGTDDPARRDRLFRNYSLSSTRTGVEIRPLCSALVERTGASVLYVDQYSTDDLRRKYEGHDMLRPTRSSTSTWFGANGRSTISSDPHDPSTFVVG